MTTKIKKEKKGKKKPGQKINGLLPNDPNGILSTIKKLI